MSQGSGPPSATGEINERNQDRNQRSGTIPPYRDDRRIVQDEPFPAQAPTPEQPPYRYNRERYPAYDANAHRIGLDHIRYDGVPNPPEQTGTRSYYRPRTRKYPTGSMDNVPHIMSINLNSPVLPSSSQLPSYGSSLPQASNATPNVGGQHRDSPSLDEQETDSAPKTRRPGVRAPPLTDYASTDVIPDATEHVRKALGLGPNQEVSLASLDDPPPGQKPQYSYPALIQLAILGSPRKRLTLSEIYTSIEARFEYYKLSQDNAWQVSTYYFYSET